MSLVSSLSVCLNPPLKTVALALAALGGVALLSQPRSARRPRLSEGGEADRLRQGRGAYFQGLLRQVPQRGPEQPAEESRRGFAFGRQGGRLQGRQGGQRHCARQVERQPALNVLLGPVKHGSEQTSAMPKARRGEQFKPIAKEQIETIKAWLDQGAKWPD